jgi:predicted small metal-binding protein
MKLLQCNDLFPGCEAEVRADSEDEVLAQAAAHAQSVHGLDTIDDQTAQAVRGAIRDVSPTT